MSVNNFSTTVINYIVKGLADKASKEIRKNQREFVGYDPDLRTITGKDQLGVISQRGLELLAGQFERANTTVSTFDKLVKQKISEYKNYPELASYLGSGDTRALLKTLTIKAVQILKTENLFNDFLEYYRQINPGGITEYTNKQNAIAGFTVKTTEHGQFNKEFKKFLLSKGFDKLAVEFIDANTDAGHLLGVFNIKFATLFDLDITPVNNSLVVSNKNSFDFSKDKQEKVKEQEDLNTLNKLFQDSLRLMSEADFVSGNLLSDVQIDVDAAKTVYGKLGAASAVELQISYLNSRSGRVLASISGRLTKLQKLAFDIQYGKLAGKSLELKEKEFRKSLDALFKSFEAVNTYIDKLSGFFINSKRNILEPAEKALVATLRAKSDTIFKNLAASSGSDSIETSIIKTVTNPLKGLSKPQQQVTKIPTITNKLQKQTTVKKVPVLKPKKLKIPTVSSIRSIINVSKSTNALASLQVLLNSKLHDQIRSNMGTGNRQDVLNYRTGRFAQSARVERLSESRQGMITAFYTYMKNPYATFSKGGRQEMPASRDPKLLISKSIRELAGPLVSNRMRAVLV